MKNGHLILPDQKVWDYAHGLAYKLACEQLAGIDDIERQCLKSGSQYIASEKAIVINYLNQPYRISVPDGEVSTSNGEAVPIRDKILILHYFIRAKGTPLTHKMITYQELPDGINYFSVFSKRTIKPIVSNFGAEPERLIDAARALEGRKADFGDVAVTIDAFSRVPVTIVLWRGDSEFSAEGSIIFDGSIVDYLANDDIHALCENITWKLVRALKTGGDTPGKHVN
jgi:hypothetical protein